MFLHPQPGHLLCLSISRFTFRFLFIFSTARDAIVETAMVVMVLEHAQPRALEMRAKLVVPGSIAASTLVCEKKCIFHSLERSAL